MIIFSENGKFRVEESRRFVFFVLMLYLSYDCKRNCWVNFVSSEKMIYY